MPLPNQVYDPDADEDPRPHLQKIDGGGQGDGVRRGNLSSVPGGETENSPQSASRPELGALEGGGQGDGIPQGNLSAAGNGESSREELKSRLAGAESNPYAPPADDQVGNGFTAAEKTWAWRIKNLATGSAFKRRALMGGGVVGGIVALTFAGFTFLSGPFQFVHLAHLLEQGNLLPGEDQSDNRLMHDMVAARNLNRNQAYRTRLGVLGNHFADKMEARLNSAGLSSAWSDTRFGKLFGLHNGLIVDRSSRGSPYYGKSTEELRSTFEAQGFKVTETNGKVVINPENYRSGIRGTRDILQTTGNSKVSASVGAHVAGRRFGWTWHPIKKLDLAIAKSIDKWWEGRSKGIKEQGSMDTTEAKYTTDKNGNPTDPQSASNATDAKGAADAIQGEGNNTGKDTLGGNPDAIDGFKSSLGAKAVKGAGVAGFGTGLVCLARGAAEKAPAIKEAQVIEPLMKLGMELVSVGFQVESGNDVSMQQLQKYSQLAYNPKDGTSALSAQPLQAIAGERMTGPDASKTLTTIMSGSPFDFLLHNAAVGAACSTVAQGALTVISFLGGAASALVGIAASMIASPYIIDALAHWISGNAISPVPRGAEYGYDAAYGTKLAAGQIALSNGARELTPAEHAELETGERIARQQTFQSKSLSYRLFNPYDGGSLLSKVMDRQSPNLSQNTSNVAFAFAGLWHSLAALPNTLFSSWVHADTPETYDYGLPTYGFSEAEMDDPNMGDPFANGEHAADVLDVPCKDGAGNEQHPCGQDYIDKASRCFGADFVKVGDQWDVQNSSSRIEILSDNFKKAHCSDNVSLNGFVLPDWLSIRFFVFDTQTMKGEACYEGDDQSCTDLGVNGSTSSTATTSTAGSQIVGNIGESSADIACADGTKSLGVVTSQYAGSAKQGSGPLKIRLCQLSSIGGSGIDNNGSAITGGAVVNSRVSGAWQALGEQAKKDGIKLSASSSFRLEDSCGGTGDNTLCALPNTSMHQLGIAIDFANIGISGGSDSSCTPRAEAPGNQYWEWLNNHAAQFGFKQYSYEAWHWDALGGPNRCGGDGTK